jgi:methyl-accepting chemotaxis protein
MTRVLPFKTSGAANLMQLPEFMRSTTLRWSFLVAGLFAAFIVALLVFIYLKTHGDLTMRSDRMITSQMDVFAALPSERRLDAIGERLKQDPRRILIAGLFGPGGRRIAGNLESLPPDLEIDNAVQSAVVDRVDESGREKQAVRLIARSLPNGDLLVIGRNVDEMVEIASVVGSAVALGLIPAVLLCLAVGVALSARNRKRIVEVNERVQRIVAGNLRERLPDRKDDEMSDNLRSRERYGEAFWRAHHEACIESELNQRRVLRGLRDSAQGVRQLACEVQGRATTAGAQGAPSARQPKSWSKSWV